MFTLLSFLGRKFDELSDTSHRRLNYTLRILVMLIAALLLAASLIVSGGSMTSGFFILMFILLCIDMGVSLKKVKEKESSELRESCKTLLAACVGLSFILLILILFSLKEFIH